MITDEISKINKVNIPIEKFQKIVEQKFIEPIQPTYSAEEFKEKNSSKEINFMDFSSFDRAIKTAELISKARCVPKEFQGNPSDILVAIQFGNELGLKPMASLQNIMIVNNKPTIYGDAMLAICMSSPDFIDCIETYDEESQTAFCTVKRKGREPLTRKFSKKMAETAGLWGKRGINGGASAWVTNPERMLQHRARGFACKDMFPDLLKGISTNEEMKDVYDYQNESNNICIKNTVDSMRESLKNKLLNKPIKLDEEYIIKE